MNLNGQNFTNFQNVRVKGDASQGGAIRFAGTSAGGFESTLSVSPRQEANSSALLDARPIVQVGTTGTIFVQLGVVAASGYLETMVTIPGMRRGDALFAGIRDLGGTTVTVTSRSYPILAGSRPEDGYANLLFINPSTTATVFTDLIIGYTAFR